MKAGYEPINRTRLASPLWYTYSSFFPLFVSKLIQVRYTAKQFDVAKPVVYILSACQKVRSW